MTTLQTPILDLITDSQSSQYLTWAMRHTLARLISMDYSQWMTQLKDHGFSPADIDRLENLNATFFNDADLHKSLSVLVTDVPDLGNQQNLHSAIHAWLQTLQWQDLWKQIQNEQFPDPIDAISYIATYINKIATSTVSYEAWCRKAQPQTQENWDIARIDIEAGIKLAEEGLQEDVKEWPQY